MSLDCQLREVPATFCFRDRVGGTIAFILILLICSILGGLLVAEESATYGALFLVCTMTPLLLLGAVFINSKLDITIDDSGIYRNFLGKQFQAIRWDNVKLIRAFPVSGGYGYTARAFNIYPTIKQRASLMPSGKMTFTDKIVDAPQFVQLLNHYISKHGIKIEIRDTLVGEWAPGSRL